MASPGNLVRRDYARAGIRGGSAVGAFRANRQSQKAREEAHLQTRSRNIRLDRIQLRKTDRVPARAGAVEPRAPNHATRSTELPGTITRILLPRSASIFAQTTFREKARRAVEGNFHPGQVGR